MNASRRLIVICALIFICLLFFFSHSTSIRQSWQQTPSAFKGDGTSAEKPQAQSGTDDESDSLDVLTVAADNASATKDVSSNSAATVTAMASAENAFESSSKNTAEESVTSSTNKPTLAELAEDMMPKFVPGNAKASGENYSMMLVIARTKKEDISWMERDIPDIEKAIYVADDPSAPLHPPVNKGHEVMIYLTYIIDHYDELSDVTLFMHAHNITWHNSDLLDYNAGKMIRQLNPARVAREGYMNLRCNWDPGCPEWLHPGAVDTKKDRKEEPLLAQAWTELFPLRPVPEVLAQPCCAQFALSRERIQAIPLETFEFYRNWLLNTKLTDYFSGRIFEYMWQAIFTGKSSHCPEMHVCYCDGYGICFGGKQQLDDWYKTRFQMRQKQDSLNRWKEKEKALNDARAANNATLLQELEPPEEGLNETLQRDVNELNKELKKRKTEAFERGKSAKLRAEELGREWHEGDGF